MLSVEDEWSKTAHYRSLSIDGGPMWFTGFHFQNVLQFETGRGNYGEMENTGWEG
jgi:hypothetical protein